MLLQRCMTDSWFDRRTVFDPSDMAHMMFVPVKSKPNPPGMHHMNWRRDYEKSPPDMADTFRLRMPHLSRMPCMKFVPHLNIPSPDMIDMHRRRHHEKFPPDMVHTVRFEELDRPDMCRMTFVPDWKPHRQDMVHMHRRRHHEKFRRGNSRICWSWNSTMSPPDINKKSVYCLPLVRPCMPCMKPVRRTKLHPKDMKHMCSRKCLQKFRLCMTDNCCFVKLHRADMACMKIVRRLKYGLPDMAHMCSWKRLQKFRLCMTDNCRFVKPDPPDTPSMTFVRRTTFHQPDMGHMCRKPYYEKFRQSRGCMMNCQRQQVFHPCMMHKHRPPWLELDFRCMPCIRR